MSATGAGGGQRRREEVTYRGIRWRRSVAGTVSWLNDGLGQWVSWYPGADAPPLPPGWEERAGRAAAPAGPGTRPLPPGRGRPRASGPGADGAGPSKSTGTADQAVQRRPMRSPYRAMPIVIAAVIVVFAIYQATQKPVKATPAQVAAAEALKGKCLVQTGGTAARPKFSPTPVNCSSASASVKVVSVVVPRGKKPPHRCPKGAGLVQVLQPGILDEPVECIEPVHHGR
jgi:hypothetical protein